jgi:hypothetical protein
MIYEKYSYYISIVNSIKLDIITFFNSESILFANSEQKNQIRAIIDILILPSYAKFVFNLDDRVKDKILDLIYAYVTLETNSIVDLKLYNFLKSYYVNNNSEKVNQSKIL